MYNSIENLSTEDLNQLLEYFRKAKEKYKREWNRMPPGALARVRENGHTRYIHLIYEKIVANPQRTSGDKSDEIPGDKSDEIPGGKSEETPCDKSEETSGNNTEANSGGRTEEAPGCMNMKGSGGKFIQRRKGITNDEAMICKLARKKFVYEAQRSFDSNINALSVFIKKYKDITPEKIIERLPDTYKDLSQEAFLPFLAKANNWASAEYERNPYKNEERKHLTMQGFKVRSKSELYIAGELYKYGVPTRYEPKLELDEKTLYPDFMVAVKSRVKFVFWEHCGLVTNRHYMDNHKRKMEIYENNGIVPWRNLIVTYDDEEGKFNAKEIEAAIRAKILI